jgi:hypothetical protein
LLLAIATFGTAEASRLAGVEMADTATVGGKQLVLNGMGLREVTWLGVDVYVAGLYVEHASSNPAKLIGTDETKMIVLRFKRHVDRDDISNAWREGFSANATVPLAQLQMNIDQLISWMPAFNKGDTLAFVFIPSTGVTVEVNGKRKGVLQGADFERSLFSVWLGSKPPTDEIKRGLLGKHPA